MIIHGSPSEVRVSSADSGFRGDRALAFTCPDGLRYLFVCDVAGRGAVADPAAEFLAASARMLVCQGMSLALIMQTLDLGLTHYYGVSGLFASAFLAAVSETSPVYVSAGHPDALVFGEPSCTHAHLSATGPLLGVFDRPSFETGAVPLRPGATLAVVTDGILEAPLRAGERLGTSGLARIVAASIAAASDDLAAAIVDGARRRSIGLVDDYAVLTATCPVNSPWPALRRRNRAHGHSTFCGAVRSA